MPNRKQLYQLVFFLVVLLFSGSGRAQDSTGTPVQVRVLAGMEASLEKRAAALEEKLDRGTQKYLAKLQRQEQKLRAKLVRKDSALAKQLFDGVQQKYEALKGTPQKVSRFSQVYSPRLDSLTTALNFLKGGAGGSEAVQKTLTQFSSLQNRLDQTEAVKRFLSDRKRLLQENLQKLGMQKHLRGFNKQAYYYSQQLNAYKALWEDPSKLEQKLLEVLSNTEAFKDFFRNNSQLGSLFALPGGNTSLTSLAGLQTRASVMQGLQDRFGTGPQVQEMIQQNLGAAQGQLSELKNKLNGYGTGSVGNSTGDIDMPEGFRPNSQKTKTFLQRLEYGVNIQSQKSTSYFPTTSDLGLSLGYKLNDKSAVGVGASYKLGWGRGWDRIRITSEGLGLRSYVDMKLKGSFYLSGGYEQNYRTAFQNLQQLKDYAAWQQSGLLGISKKYQVSKKLKGDMKLLWDFLSYQQIPRTQAILFRVGYNLK